MSRNNFYSYPNNSDHDNNDYPNNFCNFYHISKIIIIFLDRIKI